jgi:hypothetical protein
MFELSEKEQLYINVGKCLSMWNGIEAEVLRLIEYAAAHTRTVSASVRVGYWAVVSFEARLKMCDAMVSARLRGDKYKDLAAQWNALNNKLIKKAGKRAQIAHGSVVTFKIGDDKTPVHRFIPAFHRKLDEFAIPQEDGTYQQYEVDSFPHISVADMQSRTESFRKVRKDLMLFLASWVQVDAGLQKESK